MSLKPGGGRVLTAIALLLALVMAVALAAGCGGEKEENGDSKADNGKTETTAALTWPMGYQNNNRNGRSAVSGPGTADVPWTYEAGAQTRSWAVIGKDGNVIAGFEGKVVAVNPADGTAAWEFPTGATASTCVVAGDGTLYVSAGTSVYALSSKGEEKWSYDMGVEADEPALGDGTIYAGSVGGKLVALTEKGELKWESQVPGDIRSPAIDKNGNLYCSAAPLVMYAFDKSGEQKWEFKPAGDLPLYEGLFTWANTLDVPSIGDDGTIYAGTFLTPGIKQGGEQIPDYAIPQEGKVYAITPDGQLKWEYAGPWERSWTLHTPSIGRDGTLYAGTSCWRVVAIDPATGSQIWEFNTGEDQTVCPSIYSPSIGKDGLLYAATTSAKMFCITPEGTEKWRFAAEEPWLPNYGGSNNFTPPPISEDGTLFSVLAQGRIYAFKTAAAPQ